MNNEVLPAVDRLGQALREACRAMATIGAHFQAAEREAGALFMGAWEGETHPSKATDQFVRLSSDGSWNPAREGTVHCPDGVALPHAMIDDIRAEIGDQGWSVTPPAYRAPAPGESPPAVGCVPLSVWHSYLHKLGIVRISNGQSAESSAQIAALAALALRTGGITALLDGPQPGPLDLVGLTLGGVIFIGGLLLLQSGRGSTITYISTADLIDDIRRKLGNIKDNEVDDKTLEAARREREGGNVGHQHPSGREWDHQTKVRQGINGLENLRRKIEAKLRHHERYDPTGLSQEEKQELEALLREINEQLRKAREAVGDSSPTDQGAPDNAQ